LLSTILSTLILPAADVERTLNEGALQPADIPSEVPVDGFRDVMERSVRDAIEATKAVNTVQWSVDDIRGIALTIFIQRARA